MHLNLPKNINLSEYEFIVVGVSSGPDSMALLNLLKEKTKNKIVCAHINHNVRKESIKEELFLKKYCEKLNIIFESYKIEKYNENNFENEARKKRYEFYEKLLLKYNTKYLFLAHHGDDLIETVLMKIVRGSNLEGYAGIKKVSDVNNYFIIRPLLDYTKEDIINYNKKNNIKFYIDKSNKNTKYTRNRFRKYLLPFLKKENKDIHKQFIKYSNTLLEYNNYIKNEVDRITLSLYDDYLDIDSFSKIDPFMKKNIIYNILNDLYDNKSNIVKEKHVTDILNIIDNKKPNLSINLPNSKICLKEYNKLYFKEKEKNIINYCYKLKKKNIINKFIITKVNAINEDGNNICRLKSKDIKLPLYIRNKKSGDYIYIKGLDGKKKVKDIFIDSKIPLEERKGYPLIVDSDDNILWIPNIKKSKFNNKKEENCDIILTCCIKEENNEQEKNS